MGIWRRCDDRLVCIDGYAGDLQAFRDLSLLVNGRRFIRVQNERGGRDVDPSDEVCGDLHAAGVHVLGKKNREPYEFEKGSSTPNSKIPPAEKAAREEVRKAWEKANSDPSANNMAPIPRSALRKLAAAEIKNPNIHDENGKPYISVDDYIKRNYGNDWGQYEADTWEIVIG